MLSSSEKARDYLDWLLTPRAQRVPKTKREFAESIGVSFKTLYNWEKTDWFLKEVKSAKGPLLAAWYGDIMGRLKSIVDEGSDKDSVMAARLLLTQLELPEEKGVSAIPQSVEDMLEAMKALGMKVVEETGSVRTESDETSSAVGEQVES